MFDLVASQIYKELGMYTTLDGGAENQDMAEDDGQNEVLICVKPFNFRKIYRIRELDPRHIERLVTLRGIVIRCSDIVPEMKEACFVCQECQQEMLVPANFGKIAEPTVCQGCEKRSTCKISHPLSIFNDKQHIKVQETPESVPEGETPQTIHLCAYDADVDAVRPGDRVEITGIYKAMGIRVKPGMRTLKNIYRTYVDVVTYQKTDKKRVNLKDQDADKNDVHMDEEGPEENEEAALQ